MRLAKAILVRLLFGLVSLIFITFVTFIADEIAPGDAATIQAGEKATLEMKERLRHQMGLDRPWGIRYVEYLGDIARFDFGKSYYGTKEPVTTILQRSTPMTIKVASLAMLLACFLGIGMGTWAAIKENKLADRGILTLSTLGVTLPNFVVIPILVYIFAVQMDLLPNSWEVNRRASDFYYLLLPVVVLSLRPMAMLTRLTRASLIETLKQEFMRTALAKGVPPFRRIVRHGLRNAILPVITAIGTSFGFLLTGSFVVETAFNMPGLGSTAIEAIQKGDTPVVQACILLTGMMFVLMNLIVDILIPILDPRVREAQV